VRIAWRIGLSILLLALLFVFVVDAREFLRMMAAFHPGWLLLVFALFTLDRILMTYKWLLLLQAQGYRLSLFEGVTIYCSAMVWGFALPATVGADAIRAVMVARRGVNGTDVVASIVVERMIGFMLALALGVVSLGVLRLLGVLDARFDVALYAGVAMFLGSLALLVAAMSRRLVEGAIARLPRALREMKAMRYLERFASAYRQLGGARGTIARFSGLTILEQLLSVMCIWAVAMSLAVPVNLLVMLGVMPLSGLISRLPISFDGLGVFEAVFVGLLLLAGVPAESALAIAISGRVLQLLAFLPWWLVHVSRSGTARPPLQAVAARSPEELGAKG